PGVDAARDQHDLADARPDQRLDRVADHGPVVDREEVLVGDPRQRIEAAAGAAGQDDALQRPNMISNGPAPAQAAPGHESGAGCGLPPCLWSVGAGYRWARTSLKDW